MLESYEVYALGIVLDLNPQEFAAKLGVPVSAAESWKNLDAPEIDESVEEKALALLTTGTGTSNLYEAVLKKFFTPLNFTQNVDVDEEVVTAQHPSLGIGVAISGDGINLVDQTTDEELSGIYDLCDVREMAGLLDSILKTAKSHDDFIQQWESRYQG